MAEPPFEMFLHNFELKIDSLEGPAVFTASVETILGSMEEVYRSRVISLEKGERTLILNERFTFRLLVPEAFLKFALFKVDAIGQPVAEVKSFCCFLPDLLSKANSVKIALTPTDTLRIYLTVVSTESRSFNHEETYTYQGAQEELSGTLEQLGVTQRFVRGITPLRRLIFNFKRAVAEKNQKRDAKIVLALILVYFFGNWAAFLLFFYLFASKKIYQVRFLFVEGGIRYFYNQTSPLEIKQNLEFLRWQQLNLIALFDQAKFFLYLKNRTFLYKFWTLLVFLAFPAAVVVYNSPGWLLVPGALLGGYCAKYQNELKETANKSPFVQILRKFLSKEIPGKVPTPKFAPFCGRKTQKSCFIWEEQTISVAKETLAVSVSGVIRQKEDA